MEIIIATIFVMLVAYLSFLVGYIYRGYVIAKTVERLITAADKKHQNMIDRLSSADIGTVNEALTEATRMLNITLLKHEEINNQHFFYTKDTDTFVCQGNTLEEACENYHIVNKESIGCVADPEKLSEGFFIVRGKLQHKLEENEPA